MRTFAFSSQINVVVSLPTTYVADDDDDEDLEVYVRMSETGRGDLRFDSLVPELRQTWLVWVDILGHLATLETDR